ncbi:hypothetical protein BC940DRAFT_335004 [Gongronella butleri]|nr:hypothetical protein BC940DRAFT_335004 [Gongronella butleri]
MKLAAEGSFVQARPVLGGFITVQEDWIAPGQLDASELDDKDTTGHEIHSMAFINASAREEQLYVVEKYQNERERIAAPIAGLFCFVKAINWCELIYIGNMIPHALLTRFVYRNYDARRIGLPYLSLCVVHQAVGIASLCVDHRTALIALRTVYFPYVATDVRGLVFLSLLVVGFGLVFAYVRFFKFVASILLVVGIASFATSQRKKLH